MSRGNLNLTGCIFGRLTVLGRDTESIPRRGKWICRCSCESGTIRSIVSYSLTSGKTVSCGCFCRESSRKRALIRNAKPFNRLPDGIANFNALLSTYRGKARERNHKWCLTDDDVRKLFEGDCFYCGVGPSQVCARNRLNGAYTYNGIDRINNEHGYEIGNVVSCCGKCNWMKRHLPVTRFLLHVKKIVHRRFIQTTVSSAAGNSAGLLA